MSPSDPKPVTSEQIGLAIIGAMTEISAAIQKVSAELHVGNHLIITQIKQLDQAETMPLPPQSSPNFSPPAQNPN